MSVTIYIKHISLNIYFCATNLFYKVYHKFWLGEVVNNIIAMSTFCVLISA